MFCVYAVAAVLFTYIYQLTFFAAIMAITSRREMSNRHCITFRKVPKQSSNAVNVASSEVYSELIVHAFNCNNLQITASKSSSSSVYWDAVDFKNRQMRQPEEQTTRANAAEEEKSLANFFRSTYADWILNPVFRTVVVVCFLSYLVGSSQVSTHTHMITRRWPATGLSTYSWDWSPRTFCRTTLTANAPYGWPRHTSQVTHATLHCFEHATSDYGSSLHVWFYNLSRVDLGHRRLWVVLEKEVELYEHTEFTGESDSWYVSGQTCRC